MDCMFELFEHQADVGVRGIGRSWEEAFQETAKALFSIMVRIERVKHVHPVRVQVRAPDLGALLVKFLNALLVARDKKGMVFSAFDVVLTQGKEDWALTCTARGEKLNVVRHEPGTEVKAASYSELVLKKTGAKEFLAQCIVDV
ncbi:MAG: archease [Candidatus Diapherotrites archaeon]|nr:archease [Candidatus Diapherotrites archaeon]